MSRRYQGGFIRPGYNPLKVPNAPTIGTPTILSAVSVSVPFTAPSCVGGSAITGYTAVSSPGCVMVTGASSPITVGCLTTGTPYTFRVFATNSFGSSPYSATSSSVTPAAIGQQAYTAAGTYSWVAPAGVTSVSVVAVGGGGSGGFIFGGSGAGLGYKNNYSVTPGNSYTVVVGAGGAIPPAYTYGSNGNDSYFVSACVVKGGKGIGGPAATGGGTYTGDGGGNGGGVGSSWSGGGGAGGYAGAGGTAGYGYSVGPNAGTGGGGSGGGSGFYNNRSGGGGGGVGILGQGANGVPLNNGPWGTSYGGAAGQGGGGSGGANGGLGNSFAAATGVGGAYGGGGGMSFYYCDCVNSYSYCGAAGGVGAVRIIWPGSSRQFPSTNTGNL